MLPPAAGRAEVDTRPPGCEPPGRGHAVDRAGALTIDDRAVPGGLGGRPDHRQEAGPARWATLVERTTRYLVLVGLPQGPGGPTWCGRPHPPHPRTARRRDEHPDLGPGERNGPPPAPGAPPPRAGRVVRPPPQPLGRRSEREHQPPPRAATCPKAPPPPATNPTSTPSPTNRATAPAPPSTTPPHKKHSPNSLPPPLDTTVDTAPLSGHYFTGEASQYRYIQSACFRLFTASERL